MCPVACFGQTDVSAPCLNQQMGRNEMSSLVGQKNLQELLLFLHSVSHGCLCQLERPRDVLKLSGCEQAVIWNNHDGFIN